MRKYIVEPVFGHIKQARGFRQFLLRGIDKVRGEWAMICTAHNLATSPNSLHEETHQHANFTTRVFQAASGGITGTRS